MPKNTIGRDGLEDILKSVSEGVYYQKADGKICFMNPAARRIFGKSREEAHQCISLSHPMRLLYEDGTLCPEEEHPSSITLRTGKALSNQVRVVVEPGRPATWLSVNTRPIIHPGLELPEAVVITFSDITEAMEAGERLKKNEALLRAVGAMAKVGGWELEAETLEGKWTEDTFHIYEMPVGEVPCLEDAINFFHPEHRDILSRAVREALDRGRPYDLELRFITARGRKLWTRTICTPIQKDGKVIRLVGTFQDITAHKRAELELARNEERHRIAMQYANDGIFDWDLVSNEIYYSLGWKKLLGYEDHEIPNEFSEWDRLTHHRDVEESWAMLKEVLAGKRSRFANTFRMRHKDGHWVDILSRANVMRDEGGNGIRVVGTHVDISERVRAERALQKRLEFERLVSEISSDFVSLGADDIDAGIGRALGSIGRFTDADRAYVFQSANDGTARVDNTHEWCAEYIQPQMANLQNIDLEAELPWFAEKIMNREAVYIPMVDDLPPEALLERKHFEAQGIRSLITVPLVSGDRYLGFIGFVAVMKSREWTDDDRNLLQLAGQTISHALSRKQTERELKASEARNRIILMAAQDGYWRVDMQGRLLNVNDAYCRMSGYECHELLNMVISDLDAHRTPEEIAESIQRVVETGGESFETRHRRKDGSLFDLEVAVQYHQDPKGGQIVGFLHDVTERNKAEARLKEALEEARLHQQEISALLEASKEIPLADTFEGAARRIFDLCKELTGASSGYVALLTENGEENEVLFLDAGGLPCTVDPELPMPVRGLREISYRTGGVAHENDFMNSKWAKLMPEGHVVLKNVMFAPLNIKAKTVGVIGLANKPGDFTERDMKLAGAFGDLAALGLTYAEYQEELRNEKDRQANIIEGANLGTWEWNVRTGEMVFNERWAGMIGYKLAELEPTSADTWLKRIHPDELKQNDEMLMRHFSGELDYYMFECRMRHKQGHWVWVLDRGKVISRTNDGQPLWMFGTRIDITKRKQAEEERQKLEARLNQAQKMDALGTLSSGIAHDFNNLLAAIMGYAELALDDVPENSSVGQDLLEITTAATRARNLVRQILTFSRDIEGERRPVSFRQVMEETKKILIRTIPKMINLEFRLGKDLRRVKADPGQLQQVIINLATNAADAIEASGTITISAENVTVEQGYCGVCGQSLSGRHVKLSVRDDGGGIPEEIKEKIFEPFFTTKGVGKGTGLGLSTVYGIVVNHGGHIVCSSGEGRGTEFVMYFPLADDDGSAHVVHYHEAVQVHSNGGGTILVVDDEYYVRDIARAILTKQGYRVLQAESGEKALEILAGQNGRIDLILMDLGMPGMGGKACLREIKRRDPEAKVLIASGYIQYELTDELKNLGASDMVSKPYRKAELLQKVNELTV